LTKQLNLGKQRWLPDRELKQAAVALVLVSRGGDSRIGDPRTGDSRTGEAQGDDIVDDLAVLLTLRAPSLRGHAGQYALPGGRLDPGETVVDAARRELHEELGLELGEEAVLGRLDDFVTRSGYHMAPVVMWGGEVGTIVPNPDEVAEVYEVPLSVIADPTTLHSMPQEDDSELLALHIVDTLVFAPTAALLLQLAELTLHGRWVRVAHYEQPRFAWS
jgi:8-oxo-dGTP pyrophosphatase MutT (NUDIX family)